MKQARGGPQRGTTVWTETEKVGGTDTIGESNGVLTNECISWMG